MELLKEFGRTGILIAFLAYVLIFVQDSINTKLIQDSINYNLIYSSDIIYNDKDGTNLLVVHVKNSGIKSLDNIRIKLDSRNNNISKFTIEDTINFIDSNKYKQRVLKKIIVSSKNDLYPSENFSLIFKIGYPLGKRVAEKDFILSVNTQSTNGILVENALIDNKANYNNIKLYIDATKGLIFLILLYIILPLFILIIVIIIIVNSIKKTKIYKQMFINKINNNNDNEKKNCREQNVK